MFVLHKAKRVKDFEKVLINHVTRNIEKIW